MATSPTSSSGAERPEGPGGSEHVTRSEDQYDAST
eukprot:CAMPEP_0115135962 /NCGR_PEP_ID=MMETSP0227-20121206/56074_1 /TAXON_ID=89957 /ORGANISM="Polarella glacialis, Strain CCMP 1383" /LENGTH=34 /DNA_ID= /DNA_START= /DNA_END= /DNA_ORIENTATION=